MLAKRLLCEPIFMLTVKQLTLYTGKLKDRPWSWGVKREAIKEY